MRLFLNNVDLFEVYWWDLYHISVIFLLFSVTDLLGFLNV